MLFTHQLYVMFIGSQRTMASRELQRLELMNETFVMLVSYHMLLFSPFIYYSELIKFHLGFSFVGVIYLMISVNMLYIFVKVGSKLIRYLRTKHLSRRQKAKESEKPKFNSTSEILKIYKMCLSQDDFDTGVITAK